jgi:hypothetical protein
VNWEKGDGSSSYTVPAKLLLWGNVIFSNSTTILLACIRSLKSSTEMKIHKRMFFARGDTLCNDTTELSVVEFYNMHTFGSICCSCFETTGIKEISETARSFGTDTER